METLIPKLGSTALIIDIILATIFILFIGYYLFKNKKNVKMERIAFPLLYAFLYRGDFGIERMKRFAQKHKEAIKIFGYCSIGFGFFGMILAVLMIAYVVYSLVTAPQVQAVAPFLPFVDIPVLGYISFTHWILTIFLIVLVHEAAHALVILSNGLKLKNTGFGLFAIFVPFLPAAFVEPDEKQIEKQSDVIQYSISAAGPMANFVLLIPLLLISLLIINPIESKITDTNGVAFDVLQNESYPMYAAGIENGTVILGIDGKVITDKNVLSDELVYVHPGQNVTFLLLNKSDSNNNSLINNNGSELNPKAYNKTLTLVANPNDARSGFMGITNIHDNVLIKEGAKPYSGLFSWFKGLIILMTEITLSLGIINLFPASITDGGRMFNIALNRVSPNKKWNKRVILFLALVFIGIILFSFITYFTGNPFALFFK